MLYGIVKNSLVGPFCELTSRDLNGKDIFIKKSRCCSVLNDNCEMQHLRLQTIGEVAVDKKET